MKKQSGHRRQQWGKKPRGFTALEVLAVVAIIAILGALAVYGYQQYTMRARAADILLKYDAIRSGVQTKLAAQKGVDDCAQLAQSFDKTNLAHPQATLGYGFEAASGGYRPVLTVCGKADASDATGPKIARGAYDALSKSAGIEQGAVLTDTLVSFALPLTNDKSAVCKIAAPASSTNCGSASTSTIAQAPATIPGPDTCPAGADRLLVEDANYVKQWACFDACPSGQARPPGRAQCEPLGAAPPVPAAPNLAQKGAVATPPTLAQTPPPQIATPTPAAPNLAKAGATPAPATQRAPTQCRLVDAVTGAPATSVPAGIAFSGAGANRPGAECVVCGDPNKDTPCSDLDLVLAITAVCPDDKPYCLNETIKAGPSLFKEYRRCVDANAALAAMKKNPPTCPPNGLDGYGAAASRVPNGGTCSVACYGDLCNQDSQVTRSGDMVMKCE